ncbi:hypothetical protein TNCV_1993701 [Trichonephila clavipes]|nr:hypothetical protein TNCV_1993701 [Trichonephila clavipes]
MFSDTNNETFVGRSEKSYKTARERVKSLRSLATPVRYFAKCLDSSNKEFLGVRKGEFGLSIRSITLPASP